MHQVRSSYRESKIHQEIAQRFRENPNAPRVFAKRLLYEIKRLSASEAFPEQYWEWYAILTLWPGPEIIRLLEGCDEESVRLHKRPHY